jgi:hypothetical protein
MASRDEIQTIASRAIFDNAYRSRLLANPKAAAAELAIKLTRKEIKYVQSLDPAEIQRVAVEVQGLTKTMPGAVLWK